jgi:disulfide bond formation protein DsbB
MKQVIKKIYQTNLYITWGIAAGALFGSLVLSEIAKLPPCDLCWWQRVCMYPLVFILTVGILKKDKQVAYYVLPLSILGLIVSFYHTLLQWGIINVSVTSCSLTSAVSCAKAQINWLGFITIPFMSMVCFLVITILMFASLKNLQSSVSDQGQKD